MQGRTFSQGAFIFVICAAMICVLLAPASRFYPVARAQKTSSSQTEKQKPPQSPKQTGTQTNSQTETKRTARTRSPLDALGEPPTMPNQSQAGQQEINSDDVISVSTAEVLLPVTVRDATGHLISGLTCNDFRVYEDGRLQPLSDLALRQVPVDVVLMVDASSSVAENLEDFRRAVEGFAGKLSAEDRISLIKFDDRIELLQDWTRSRTQLRRALQRVAPGMFTRFYDALYLAAKEQLPGTRSRHAIIVLTDGIDNGPGTMSLESALRSLLESQASVYVISNTEIERRRKQAELDTYLNATNSVVRFNQLHIDDLRLGLRVLEESEANLAQLTEATGGKLYRPESFARLNEVYAEVAEELRQQYALYYVPLDKARDGRFRRIKVETSNPTQRVSARTGYFAPKS